MTLDQRRAALHRKIDELDEDRLGKLEAALDGPVEPSPDQVMGYTIDGRPFTYAELDERGRQAKEASERGELISLDELRRNIAEWGRAAS